MNPKIRDALNVDIPALARLHVQAFNETHGRGPNPDLRETQWREKLADPARLVFCVIVEDQNGDLIGFASGERRTSEELAEFEGLLDKIYLLRKYHRRGLGRRLICASAERFVSRRIGSMLLFGDARSPSNGFYEAMGGERLYSATGEFHGSYGWRDLAGLVSVCGGQQEQRREAEVTTRGLRKR